MNRSKEQHGFTLIELMVVVAVIGILAAIALPSYNRYVQKTRRSAASACLVESAQFMERFYTTNMTYAGATLPGSECMNETGPFYAITLAAQTASTYTVQAAPHGAQAGDSCGTLSLTSTGAKSPTTTGCW